MLKQNLGKTRRILDLNFGKTRSKKGWIIIFISDKKEIMFDRKAPLLQT